MLSIVVILSSTSVHDEFTLLCFVFDAVRAAHAALSICHNKIDVKRGTSRDCETLRERVADGGHGEKTVRDHDQTRMVPDGGPVKYFRM